MRYPATPNRVLPELGRGRKLTRRAGWASVPWAYVITLPDARPGTPDLASPDRFLWGLARRQWRTLIIGSSLGILWTLTHAALPGVLGATIDAGLVHRDGSALATGTAALFGLAVLQAATGVIRHRYSTANWLQATLRTQQHVGHHVADAGLAVTARTTTGEAIATAASDAGRIGMLLDVTGRFFGAVATAVAVAVVVLRIDVALGLAVVVGLPLLTASLLVVVRPLGHRQSAYREAEGRLTALGADTVAGLRVLRGMGGEDQFLRRYVERSGQVRAAGIRVTGPQAALEGAHVLLPGAFVVGFTWLGARAAVEGRITPGELVALYGYAALFSMLLVTATEGLGKIVRARVAATRVVRVLRQRPGDDAQPQDAAAMPPPDAPVADPASGLTLAPGRLTAVVSARPEDAAAIADRLARLCDDAGVPAATIGGVPVTRLPAGDVRRRILVCEAEPRLFSGTLHEEIDPTGERDGAAVLRALEVADAVDVAEALPGGLDGRVEERGRGFSGGQRQRLALARAVLADPPVLVLVEPTSAVDAHTEARVADRLRAARRGRTTLVATTSPLLLDRADRVVFLAEGRVAAEGTHRELLRTAGGYRDTVIRGEDL